MVQLAVSFQPQVPPNTPLTPIIVQEVAPERFAALFAFENGTEPRPESDLVPLFETLEVLEEGLLAWPGRLATTAPQLDLCARALECRAQHR